jgi:transglutaminase-like putative cysteine protease
MRFEIEHSTCYTYSNPVSLSPQTIRLQPRGDGSQHLLNFECLIEPTPRLVTNLMDLEGNVVTRAWFDRPTDYFKVQTRFNLETLRRDPFDYLPETHFQRWPIAYPEDLEGHLTPYLNTETPNTAVIALSNAIATAVNFEALPFLEAVNQYIHETIKGEIRETGSPQTPDLTLNRRRGACRDLAVLFMAICRQQGFACRFVSGYQARTTRSHQERRYLHAWAEVYIPGGGWRGYDQTRGQAVADAHVALAAARIPKGATPIGGSFTGAQVQSQMDVSLKIQVR